MRVLATHRESIFKVAANALAALENPQSADAMRNAVAECRMRLGMVMDNATAAAHALQ